MWAPLLKVNSFTGDGKINWAKACGLDDEYMELTTSLQDPQQHQKFLNKNKNICTANKNLHSYALWHQYRRPPFMMDSIEGKY